MPNATPIHKSPLTGKMVSVHSKAHDSACSAAASQWRLKQATPQTYVILAKCRKDARGHASRRLREAAGKIAPGRETPVRMEKAAQLKAAHAAKAAKAAAAPKAAAATPTPAAGGFSLKPGGAASKPSTPSMFGRTAPAPTPGHGAARVAKALDPTAAAAPAAPKSAGLPSQARPAPTDWFEPPAPAPPTGETPSRPFGLKRESAEARKAAAGFFNQGNGRQGTLLDIKKGDLPGQTSLLDQVPSVDTHTAGIVVDPGTAQPATDRRPAPPKAARPTRADRARQRAESQAKGAEILADKLKTPEAADEFIAALDRREPVPGLDLSGHREGAIRAKAVLQARARATDTAGASPAAASPAPKPGLPTSQLPGGTRPALGPEQIKRAVAEVRAEKGLPPLEKPSLRDQAESHREAKGRWRAQKLNDAVQRRLLALGERRTADAPGALYNARENARRRQVVAAIDEQRQVLRRRSEAIQRKHAFGPGPEGPTTPAAAPPEPPAPKAPRVDRLARALGRLNRHREVMAGKVATPGNPLHNRNIEVFGRSKQMGHAEARAREEIRKELTGGTEPAEAPAPLPLPDFASKVVEAAQASPTGKFGGEKTFISHAWRAVKGRPEFRGMDEAQFKSRLVEANRARLLDLGRGDLVGSMDPADVRESATPHLNAVYHFVRHPEAAAPSPSPAAATPPAGAEPGSLRKMLLSGTSELRDAIRGKGRRAGEARAAAGLPPIQPRDRAPSQSIPHTRPWHDRHRPGT